MKILVALPRGPLSGRLKRTISDVASRIEVLDNVVVFPESTEANRGVFIAVSNVLVGSKIGTRESRTYTSGWLFSTSRKFTPRESLRSSELPLQPAPYRIELDTPGSGRIELPGYRLKNGVLLLYTTPIYEFRLPGDVLAAGDLEDYAQLSLRPIENGIEGEATLSLRKAEYADVVIRGKAAEDVVFLGSENGRFTYEFIREPTLVISHEKVLSPQGLQKAMDGFIGLSGHGEFALVLEVGQARKEMDFSVNLGTE